MKKKTFLPDFKVEEVFTSLSQSLDWSLKYQNIPDTWKVTQGEGVTIVVIDTGMPDHEDIGDNAIEGENFIQGEENAKIKQYFDPKNTSNGISYSLAQFTLEIGEKTKLHKIKSSEIYYILEGNGKLRIDGNEFELKKNDSAYVPPNSEQFFENIGSEKLQFLCIVEPAWKQEDDEILE